MKAFLISFLIAGLTGPLLAGGRRHAAASAPPEEIAISFVEASGKGSEAFIDAGTLSLAHTRSGRRTKAASVTTRVFGIRLDAGSTSATTAMLSASLESYDGRSVIRIDGIELTPVARVIQAQVAIGALTMHTMEIEVPASVPEGAFGSAIRWEATTK